MKKAVLCVVASKEQADDVVIRLQQDGFPYADISVLFPDAHGARDFAHEHNTKAPEGAVAGASLGGVVVGAIGLLAGLGLIVIPGIGPILAAGPIAAALSGVAVGGVGGGVIGSLVGSGIPELEAKMYEGKLRSGNLIVAVHTEDAEERRRAANIFKRARATDISTVTEEHLGRDARI